MTLTESDVWQQPRDDSGLMKLKPALIWIGRAAPVLDCFGLECVCAHTCMCTSVCPYMPVYLCVCVGRTQRVQVKDSKLVWKIKS